MITKSKDIFKLFLLVVITIMLGVGCDDKPKFASHRLHLKQGNHMIEGPNGESLVITFTTGKASIEFVGPTGSCFGYTSDISLDCPGKMLVIDNGATQVIMTPTQSQEILEKRADAISVPK